MAVLVTIAIAACELCDNLLNLIGHVRPVLIALNWISHLASTRISDDGRIKKKRYTIRWRKDDVASIFLALSMRKLFLSMHSKKTINSELFYPTWSAFSVFCSVEGCCQAMVSQRSSFVRLCNWSQRKRLLSHFRVHLSQVLKRPFWRVYGLLMLFVDETALRCFDVWFASGDQYEIRI